MGMCVLVKRLSCSGPKGLVHGWPFITTWRNPAPPGCQDLVQPSRIEGARCMQPCTARTRCNPFASTMQGSPPAPRCTQLQALSSA